jgi:phenylalanyl-tRNA synthetase beta chain
MVCRKSNQDVGNHDVRLFETASTWTRVQGEIVEQTRLAVLADAPDAGLALRALRGTVEELIRTLCGDAKIVLGTIDSPIYSSGATIQVEGQTLGSIGVVSPSVAKLFDLHTPLVAGEMDLNALIKNYPPVRLVQQLPRFPGIERDLSVVVDETVAWGSIQAAVEAVAPALLERIDFLVTYRGKPIVTGKKSVSFRMLFRDPSATLRHEQVDPQVASVIERLKSGLGAELRA